MADIIRFLIPDAKAQTIDALSQPTFGVLDVGSSNVTTGSVLLSSSSTSVEVGQTFTVTVEVKTNTVSLSEYRIFIDFDPTALKVVGDSDSNTEGTQMTFLDDIFVVLNPTANNTVSSIGRASLVATAPAGPLSVNKQVLQIQFQAQKQTNTSIKIVQGTTGTQLLRSQGVTAPYTSNELTIQVGTNVTTPPANNPTPNPVPVPVTTSQPVIPPPVIPNTSIASDITSLLPMLFGIILIVIGGSLVRKKNKNDDSDIWL